VSSDSDEQTVAAVLIAVTRGSGNRCDDGLLSTVAVALLVTTVRL